MAMTPVTANTVQAIRPATQASDLQAMSPMDRSIADLDKAIAALQKQYGAAPSGGGDAFTSGLTQRPTHATTHGIHTHQREPVHQQAPAHQTHAARHAHATHQTHATHRIDQDDAVRAGTWKGAQAGTPSSDFLNQFGGFGKDGPAQQLPAEPVRQVPVQIASNDLGPDNRQTQGPGNSQSNYGHSEEHMDMKGGGGRSGAVIGNYG